MYAAAQSEGIHCGATRQAILGYERGRIPHPEALRWLAAAVGLPIDEVTAAARRQRRYRLELRLLTSAGAMGSSGQPQCGTLDEDVERREVLLLFGRAATAGLLTSTLGQLPALASPAPVDAEAIEAATTVSRSYRRLWLTTPAEDLRELVLGHVRLISRLLTSTSSEKDQARLAAAASDTALLAAWLAEDSWDVGAANRHYGEARSYAERSQDDHVRAYVACCMSEWAAWGTGSGAEAVRLVQEAKHLLPRSAPSAAHTYVAAHEATAYATAHDEPAMSSALLRAEKALDETNGSSDAIWPWVFPMNDQEVSRYRGVAAVSLKLPKMAVPALRKGLDSLGRAPTKRRGYTLSKLAEAHVQTGDVEQACHLGAEAFTVATQLRDTWSLMVLRNVRAQLTPMEATRAVRSFDERVLSTLLALPR
jgi:transcriptional regulator with XRE-family HTH domain